MKTTIDSINNILIPTDASFIDDKRIEVKFNCPFNELDENSSTISYLNTDSNEINSPITFHNDSESITAYSSDGKIRAVLRKIPYQKTMPSSVKKVKEQVSLIEIFCGQKIINRKILDEEFATFTKHPTISNGIQFSNDNKKICYTVSDENNFEKDSELGYKVKYSQFKDFGEDLDEIYHTSLVVYDIEKNELLKIKAPEKFCVCKGQFVSNNIIIIQAVDYSQNKILGLRSYTNREYALFVVNIEKPNDVVKIMEPKQVYFDTYKLNENLVKVFSLEMSNDYPGHDGPLYPKTFLLNLNNFEISDIKKSDIEIFINTASKKMFLNENEVIFNEEFHGYVFGTILNLNNFTKYSLPISGSLTILDIRNNKILYLKSTPVTIPQLFIYENYKEKPLTNYYNFDLEYSHEYIGDLNDYCNIIILKSKNSKKFILLPHGGPHGMTSTKFNKRAIIFALKGYNVVHINYIGSTGQPLNSINKIFGKCGISDLNTIVETANYIKKKI